MRLLFLQRMHTAMYLQAHRYLLLSIRWRPLLLGLHRLAGLTTLLMQLKLLQ